MSPRASGWAVAAALALLAAGGTALRLTPWLIDRDGAFLSDAAFHIRMVGECITNGHTPRVDPLCDAPEGRRLDRWLPLGFYPAVAAFHRAMAAAGRNDPRANALLALALAGGLIALPAFAGAWALTRDRWGSLTAALVAIVLPAHVHRTYCFWFRYEAAGSLLIATHVALGLLALAAASARGRIVLSALSGMALIAALDVWRVAFMIPVLEVGFAIALALGRPAGRELRDWLLGVVVGGTTACLAIGYLRAQAFVLSPAWGVAMCVTLAMLAPWMGRTRSRFAGRAITLAIAVAIGLGFGMLARPERQYTSVLHAALEKLGLASPAMVSPMASLALSVEELAGSSPAELFGPGGLSWLGAGLAIAIVVLWWIGGRPLPRRLVSAAPAPTLLAWLCVTLVTITLLFARNKVVLAPMVAIAVGAAFAALRKRLARVVPGGQRARKPTPSGAGAAAAAIALLALAILGATVDSLRLVRTRSVRLDADLGAVYGFLARETPPGAIVVATWERGYEIQSWAGRRTVVDGLLEDPVVMRRVPELSGAFLQRSGDSLAAFCRRRGASYVLVPSSRWLLALLRSAPFGMRAELVPLAEKVESGVPLTPREADRIVIRMMVLGESPAPFVKVFQQGPWRVYRLAP